MMRRHTTAGITWTAVCLPVGLACITVRGQGGIGANHLRNGAGEGEFWSFKPVTRPALPAVRDESWVRNPIDRFILEREGLGPAPDADKLTLLRRVKFDTTGLPPTPQEIRAFLADESADSYEK